MGFVEKFVSLRVRSNTALPPAGNSHFAAMDLLCDSPATEARAYQVGDLNSLDE
jgi:hypothetical protein